MPNRGADWPDRIVFGTRDSALAFAQTSLIITHWQAAYPTIAAEIAAIRTEGDLDKTSPLTEIGGRGVFTTALEEAILDGRIDAAVHSAKDLPSSLSPRAPIVAILERDDPRDALVSRHNRPLAALPPAPIIGTSSQRRAMQVRHLRPDAVLVNLRGNVDTRLRKASEPGLDGIVVAAAGLQRLGRAGEITQYFTVEEMVPAPAQGALAIQSGADSPLARLLADLDDDAVSRPVRIERGFLATLGAGCTVPVGAFARVVDGRVRFLATLGDATGERSVRVDEWLDPDDEVGHAADIARRLLTETRARPEAHWNGARGDDECLGGARVVVTRPRRQASALIAALRRAGAAPIPFPTTRIVPAASTETLDAALLAACQGRFSWLVFTSVNAVDAVAARMAALDIDAVQLAQLRVAAVGNATAAAASRLGLAVAVVPRVANADALAAALRGQVHAGERVLQPRSAIGRDSLVEALRAHGAEVAAVAAYETITESEVDPDVQSRLRQHEFEIATFASPSSVRSFVDLVGGTAASLARIAAVCGGEVTASEAEAAGFGEVIVAADPSIESMVTAVVAWWRERSGRETAVPERVEGESLIGSAG